MEASTRDSGSLMDDLDQVFWNWIPDFDCESVPSPRNENDESCSDEGPQLMSGSLEMPSTWSSVEFGGRSDEENHQCGLIITLPENTPLLDSCEDRSSSSGGDSGASGGETEAFSAVFSCDDDGEQFTYKLRSTQVEVESLGDDDDDASKNEFCCQLCPKSFSKSWTLKMHVKYVHNRDQLLLIQCRFCDFTTRRKQTLRDHELTHSEVRNYKCQICSKTFKQRQVLRSHIRLHDGESYSCTMCDYSTKRKDTFRNHLSVHSEEKKFKCDHCPKSYKTREGLQNHTDTHSSSAPLTFQCEQCSRSLKTKKTLGRHVRLVHSRES